MLQSLQEEFVYEINKHLDRPYKEKEIWLRQLKLRNKQPKKPIKKTQTLNRQDNKRRGNYKKKETTNSLKPKDAVKTPVV